MTNDNSNRPPFSFFLTVSLFMIILSSLIIQSGYYFSNTDIFSLAITIDIVFFIPVIYILLIRKRKISKITIIPVIALSYLITSILLPPNDQTYLEITKKLLMPLETEPDQSIKLTILVDDIREAIKKIKSAGGIVLGGMQNPGEPDEVPGVGLFASFIDTEGNVVSVYEDFGVTNQEEEE